MAMTHETSLFIAEHIELEFLSENNNGTTTYRTGQPVPQLGDFVLFDVPTIFSKCQSGLRTALFLQLQNYVDSY